MAEKININEPLFRTHQKYFSSLVVDAMIEGVKLGHKLPPLTLHQCVSGFDDLEGFGGYFYGVFEGNHRLVVCKRMEINPEWETPPGWAEIPYYEFLHKDLTPVDGVQNYDTMYRLKNSLSFLPRKSIENFCEKNDLDPRVYLSQ